MAATSTLSQIISSPYTAGQRDATGTTVIKYHLAAYGESAVGTDPRAEGATFNYVSKGWDSDAADMIRSALASYSSVANIRFEEVGLAEADFRFVRAEIPNLPGDTTYALMGFPDGSSTAGTAVFDDTAINFWGLPGAFEPGGRIYEMALHEIGHGLGLFHTHRDGQGDSTYFPGAENANDLGTAGLNQRVYSVMSYNGGFLGEGGAAGPMAVDIAALGSKYGLRALGTGDGTYALVDDSEEWRAVYDTGGTDTIRYDGVRDVTIDLREATLQQAEGGGGYLSRIMSGEGGLTIANGTAIENAFGGAGNDILVGNALNNLFMTHSGNDRVDGGAGTDTASYADEYYSGVTVGASFDQGGAFRWAVEKLAGDEDALYSVEKVLGSSLSDRFLMDDATLAALRDGRTPTGLVADLGGNRDTEQDVLDLSKLTVPYVLTQSSGGAWFGVNGATASITGVESLVDGIASTSVRMGALRTAAMGGGDDTVYASATAEDMDGGTNSGPNPARENDTLSYAGSTSAVTLNFIRGTGEGGHAEGDTFKNFETVIGSAFADTFVGGNLGVSINGGGGRDIYIGGSAKDVFTDSEGGVFDYSKSAAGIGISWTGSSGLTFRGSGGDAEGDVLNLGYADGTGYNPLEVIGSASNDTLATYGWVRATFWGGDGDDTLTGGIGTDRLMGGAGRDTIAPGESNGDYIDFGAGGGTLVEGTVNGIAATHTMGSGHVDFFDSAGRLYAQHTVLGDYDTWSGRGNVTGTAAAETYLGAETVHAGGGDDTISGGVWLDQALFGEDGDDRINVNWSFQYRTAYANGGAGHDVIHAENAAQGGYVTVEGGAGNDDLYVGTGVTVSYAGSQSGVTVIGNAGYGGDAQGDRIIGGYSALVGSEKADTISTSAASSVYGAGGDDVISNLSFSNYAYGGTGNDVMTGTNIYGESGNDTLTGMDVSYIRDNLYGGIGNDVARGMKGDDYIDLGTGADTLVYAKGDGNDQVYGFSPGEDHVLILRQSGYSDPTVTQESLGTGNTKVVLAWQATEGGQATYDAFVLNGVAPGSLSQNDFLFA